MSRGHIEQCSCKAGLGVEERCRLFSSEGWDGVWGDVAPRLALQISQSRFALLLVPESRLKTIHLDVLEPFPQDAQIYLYNCVTLERCYKYHLTCRPSGGRDCCISVFPSRSSSSRAEFPGVEPDERG